MAATVLVEGAEILDGTGDGVPLEGLFLAISEASKGGRRWWKVDCKQLLPGGQFGLVDLPDSGLNLPNINTD